MSTTDRHRGPHESTLARVVADRLDSLLALEDDGDSVVVDLRDPDVRTVIRCRALAYAARYLRSVLADQAADLLEDRIEELGGKIAQDQTQVVSIDLVR